MTMCKCGCGQEVKPGKQFIQGHHNCNVPWTPLPIPTLCECGCGGYAQPGNRFINGHNTRNRSSDLLDSIAEKVRQFYINNPDARESAKIKAIEFSTTKEFREAARLKSIEYWSDQANRATFSVIKRNSVATKEAAEKQRGGSDDVWHHIAYDFNDTSALRVRISRKAHSTIHHPKGIPFSVRVVLFNRLTTGVIIMETIETGFNSRDSVETSLHVSIVHCTISIMAARNKMCVKCCR